jgi:hypothetical protein
MGSARRTILNLSRALHALERAVCLGSRAAHSLHNLYAAQGDLVALSRRRPLKAHSSSASREASRNPPPTVTPKPHSRTHQPEPARACPSLVIVLDNSTSATSRIGHLSSLEQLAAHTLTNGLVSQLLDHHTRGVWERSVVAALAHALHLVPPLRRPASSTSPRTHPSLQTLLRMRQEWQS